MWEEENDRIKTRQETENYKERGGERETWEKSEKVGKVKLNKKKEGGKRNSGGIREVWENEDERIKTIGGTEK